MSGLLQDLRYALRTLARAPLLVSVAVVTLAVGIGANGAVFAVVDAVLLRPLPYPDAGDLYSVAGTYEGRRREFVSVPDLWDWQASSRSFAAIAATRGDNVTIATPAGPEYLLGTGVSRDFFAVLGVQPALGRAFAPDEYEPGRHAVAILGHGIWQRRFGGDPGVIGRSVVMDEEPVTVVGVMPQGFAYPEDSELWRPFPLVARESSRSINIVRAIGRVRPGVDPSQVQAEMDTIAARIAEAHPEARAGWGVVLTPLHDRLVQSARPTLVALAGAVACVLLIACANVAVLLLSFGLRRGPELAIRAALGAGRRRVARQLIAEGLLLGVAGGTTGAVLAAWALSAFRTFQPAVDLGVTGVTVDWRVAGVTAALSIATGAVLGLAPARGLLRLDLQDTLRHGSRQASAPRQQRRLSRAFVAGQVAVTLVLLTGAGLMIATIDRLQAVDLGFDPNHLLTTYVRLPEGRYAEAEQVHGFYRELLERVRALPGVQGASAINALYVHWANAIVLWPRIEGREPPPPAEPPDTHIRIVAPGFERVLGVPVLRGRSITEADDEDAPQVVVINEAMARRYFAGEDPIGQRVQILVDRDGKPAWQEIVGVVGNVRQGGLDAEPQPEILVPYVQTTMGQMAVVVRTAGDPLALVPGVRGVLHDMDPTLPLTYVQTMDEVLEKTLAPRRLGMDVLGAFASTALVLAALGIFAVVAAAVASRRRELAIRMAIGAAPGRVFQMVMGEVAATALIGIAAGTALASAATTFLEPLLFGIDRSDAATYLTTAAVLLSVALASGYLPARRSARLDPVAVLRSE